LDYRRADQPPLALIEDSPMEESSSEPPMPNPNLPADHWRNVGRGKGKDMREAMTETTLRHALPKQQSQ
jgi:hypothetical protein